MYSQANFVILVATLFAVIIIGSFLLKRLLYVTKSISRAKNTLSLLVKDIEGKIFHNLSWKQGKLTLRAPNDQVAELRATIDIVMTTYNLTMGVPTPLPDYVVSSERVGDCGYYYRCIDSVHHVAFRGTSTRKDIAVDLDFTQSRFKGVWYDTESKEIPLVHHGFFMWWNRHTAALVDVVRRVPDGELIRFSGHSMGCALAAFSALDCAARGKSRVECTLVASPRLGDDVFTAELVRLVGALTVVNNERDLVTNLPPPNIPLLVTTYIYDSYPPANVLLLNFETNEITGNHQLDSYATALEGGKPSKWRWNRAPRH